MNERLSEVLRESLASGVREGVFPGGIAALAAAGRPPAFARAGKIAEEADAPAPDLHTLYDLASLTKVVATLPAVLLSVQAGRLSLADPAVYWLPELERGVDRQRKREITLFHLLTHTSGLPAWRPYYLGTRGRDGYLRAIAREPLIGPPGGQVVYSDLGFMLLGFVLERIWDEPLDALAKRLVFAPLGMVHTAFRPKETISAGLTAAPTERGNPHERRMAADYVRQRASGLLPAESFSLSLEQVEAFPWRQELIREEVHDGNAHYGLDGVSGHAGLFSTVEDLLRYMRIWSDPAAEGEDLLDPVLKAWAVRCHTGPLAPRRAVGWEKSSTGGTLEQIAQGCSGGDLVSSEAFGHTGFTGTSIWRDPERQVTLITLTNRVHPAVKDGITGWRRRHHNAVFSAAGRLLSK